MVAKILNTISGILIITFAFMHRWAVGDIGVLLAGVTLGLFFADWW